MPSPICAARRERRRCAMSTATRLTDATRVSDIASIRRQFGDHAPALVETVLLRRKATAKFADPSNWLFTDDALQQATAQAVAEHRARRLAGATVHDVTCSVGTELAALRNSAGLRGGQRHRSGPARHGPAQRRRCAAVPCRRVATRHPRRRRPRRPCAQEVRAATVRPARLHPTAGPPARGLSRPRSRRKVRARNRFQ